MKNPLFFSEGYFPLSGEKAILELSPFETYFYAFFFPAEIASTSKNFLCCL